MKDIPCVGRRHLALSLDSEHRLVIDILWREDARRLATLVLEPKDAAELKRMLTALLTKARPHRKGRKAVK